MDRLRNINNSLIDCTISKNTTSVLLLDQYCKLQTAIYKHRKIARSIPNWLHEKGKMTKKMNLQIGCNNFSIRINKLYIFKVYIRSISSFE